MAPTFTVTLFVGAFERKRFEVPASTTRGLMAVPDFEHCTRHLPPTYLAALSRGVWEQAEDGSEALRCELTTKTGRRLGHLVAVKG